MSKFNIDQKNSLHYEYEEGKDNAYTLVFVNALTVNTSTWNGPIGKRVEDEGHNYLTYNFVDKLIQVLTKSSA